MADYDSSLPIRTEGDGDVVVKVSDATVTSQQLKVNADGSIDTNIAPGSQVEITDGTDTLAINVGGSINAVVTATNLDIRDLTHISDSVSIGDGVEIVAVNASNEMQVRDDDANTVLTTLNAKFVSGTDIGDVTINNASGAAAVNIQDGGNSITVDALNLDIRDLTAAQDNVAISDGTDTMAVNTDGSINVVVSGEQDGIEIVEYNTSASVAKNASVNHDYTVTAAKTFIGEEIVASGSGKLKVEVLINAVPVFTMFNSTSTPNVRIPLEKVVKANATEVIRITITNRDNQPQDLYSTLIGVEV